MHGGANDSQRMQSRLLLSHSHTTCCCYVVVADVNAMAMGQMIYLRAFLCMLCLVCCVDCIDSILPYLAAAVQSFNHHNGRRWQHKYGGVSSWKATTPAFGRSEEHTYELQSLMRI